MNYEREPGAVRFEKFEQQRRLIADETLARRLDETDRVAMNGLAGINSWIERAVYDKQTRAGLSYEGALKAVALAQPALFLTKARLELDQTARAQPIYFSFVGGQLVDPCIMENGALKRIDSPLNTCALPGLLTMDQEIALRVADKMQPLSGSSGAMMDYGQALKLVARENPVLFGKREAPQSSRDGVAMRFIAFADTDQPTLEKARAELKTLTERLASLIWTQMNAGKKYTAAFDTVSKEHPELNERESQLRTLIKAMEGWEEKDSVQATSATLNASDVHSAEEAEVMVLRLVESKQKANPGMSYGSAMKFVAAANPGLFRKRERFQRESQREL